ncbi:MAG: hypothetical protein JO053_01315 [Acidobacteria bacterium]|nr:hypothetical protein [Acidobacteriota bacterium]
MAEKLTPKWIGVVALILGLLSALMLVFELKDGTLLGSKSDGMTVTSHPVVFFIGVTLQGLVVLLLMFGGLSIARRKDR